jgi:acyl-homoserine lactone acylase PvdQ
MHLPLRHGDHRLGCATPSFEPPAAAVTITGDDWGIAHVSAATNAQVVFGAICAQAEDDFSRVEANPNVFKIWAFD